MTHLIMTHRAHVLPLLLAVGLAAAAPAAAQEPPGIAPASFQTAHHDTEVAAAIWYPAASTGPIETVFENTIFAGVRAQPDASPAAGSHPLVLLSHGLGGTHRSLAWLAAGLASRGAIVVAVDHPGSNFADFETTRATRHWTRVQDLSAVLDAVLSDPPLGLSIDPARIAAVGFSYGGATALSLAGLRGDLDAYRAHCAQTRGDGGHCDLLADAGLDLGDFDARAWDARWGDARIRRVAAIDPGPQYPRTRRHVADIAVPMLLVALGEGPDRLRDADFSRDGSGFAPLLAQAGKDVSTIEIAPAHHFTAMQLCKPAGAALLAAEGDDPVCDDPPGTDRTAVHARIVSEVADFLGLE